MHLWCSARGVAMGERDVRPDPICMWQQGNLSFVYEREVPLLVTCLYVG